jgi:trehalose 6-phosphate synthase/phosphatase
VARINSQYGEVIDYREAQIGNMQLQERLALWSLGDILWFTSVREAVNLHPFEYAYTTRENGVLILSEFLGASRLLNGAIRINPWKIEEIVGALQHALTMGAVEREVRNNKHIEYVERNTTTTWAQLVLGDLKRASLANRTMSGQGDNVATVGFGLGLDFRIMHLEADFRPLDVDSVLKAYRSSLSRLLLFDFGGTLVKEEHRDAGYKSYQKFHQKTFRDKPSEKLIRCLKKISMDSSNIVFILSGKEKEWMQEAFADTPGLGLAAEHGFYHIWPSKRCSDPSKWDWELIGDVYDDSWKDLTAGIMSTYTLRTNGSYIERKGSAIVWHHRDADPEFGALQAKELEDHLTGVLIHFPVEVLSGNDYVEVRPEGVSKGLMVEHILHKLASKKNVAPPDFILCIGDDASDEPMFNALDAYMSAGEQQKRAKCFTCTVGKKPSEAKNYLNDVDEVLDLLDSTSRLSIRANRNASMNDLPSMVNFSPSSSPEKASLGSSRSMSMVSMSALGGSSRKDSTSKTMKEFLSNIDEDAEGSDEDGGIFF